MILAISGSLRRSSINSALLRAAAVAAARSGIGVQVDDSQRQMTRIALEHLPFMEVLD